MPKTHSTRSTSRHTPKTKPPTLKPELPEWLKDTPVIQYTLETFNTQGGIEQQIDLTLEEYDELKNHLAKIRGIAVPEVSDEEK